VVLAKAPVEVVAEATVAVAVDTAVDAEGPIQPPMELARPLEAHLSLRLNRMLGELPRRLKVLLDPGLPWLIRSLLLPLLPLLPRRRRPRLLLLPLPQPQPQRHPNL
jgi:hypothetical protein